jgi:hypothetical protein
VKIRIEIEIDGDDGGTDRIIRQQVDRLAASDQSLADAVAAAGGTPQPRRGFHVPPPNKKAGAPTGNATIDALIAQVTVDQTVIGSATTLINGIQQEIADAVTAALANGATATQLAPLTDLTTALAASDAALAAAVAANTPPAPPPANAARGS